ncbi:hypothetical protein MAR_017345 [Mya arenaria]|uniref:Uncharacterized protein n=1 Tax=Mya arenaria TaxID=6604 RepID=A0ABY7EBH4_MYAAR|nr:hypothetical protein MAR_017345 [Mya arenaria]
MAVKLNFKKKRIANTKLVNANKKVKILDDKVMNLQRRNSCLRKKLQHLKESKERVAKTHAQRPDTNTENELTPKSMTRVQLKKDLNMTPKSRKKAFRRLKFQNCVLAEEENINSKKGKQSQRPLLQIFVGRFSTNAKWQEIIAKSKFAKQGKALLRGRFAREEKRKKLKELITAFMERDDNSTCLPGKRDSQKIGKVHHQKRFRAENSSCNVSLTTYTRIRPKHIQLVQYRNRQTCLCQRHQNMALKCKALKDYKVLSFDNPDTVVDKMNDTESLEKIEGTIEDSITFSEWRHSPTSQYSYRQIFSVIAKHDHFIPGIQTAWLYFEAGHGKGACDGVGGTAKRLAGMAVKRHKAIIQSAKDFFRWGQSQ